MNDDSSELSMIDGPLARRDGSRRPTPLIAMGRARTCGASHPVKQRFTHEDKEHGQERKEPLPPVCKSELLSHSTSPALSIPSASSSYRTHIPRQRKNVVDAHANTCVARHVGKGEEGTRSVCNL